MRELMCCNFFLPNELYDSYNFHEMELHIIIFNDNILFMY